MGTVTKAYRAIDNYTAAVCAVIAWLRFKHKGRPRKGSTYALPHLYGYFGLVRLTGAGRNGPWVKTCSLVREPDAEKLLVRFDERDVKTEL